MALVSPYAGFLKRAAAIIIDGLILMVGYAVVFFAAENLAILYSILGGWLYFAIQESSEHQATFGKRALGIIVVDEQGNRISFGRATGRFFAKWLSGVILYIGYIMAAFTARKQALHDLIAGTLVINK